jgi:AmmeMemoRadiSam system protein B/AmmeMemoRadiSam system protein A
MKNAKRHLWVISAAFLAIVAVSGCARSETDVRPPAVAGQFYPADANRLRLAIQGFMKDAVPVTVEHPIALVAPHAGYIYSGQICADAYRQAAGNQYELVVILGTNHTTPRFSGISVFTKGAYQTPLGNALVDETAARALLTQDHDCTSNVEAQVREHSVEVQVPFVQVLFPSAKILPVVIGEPDLTMCTHFGQELAKVLKGRKALIVASSDLSHYPAYKDAAKTDRETLMSLIKLDPADFASKTDALVSGRIPNLVTCACGEGPILAAMAAAKSLGATRGVIVSYANSGDTALADLERVVGYGAVALTTGKGAPETEALDAPEAAPAESPLESADKKALLSIARETLHRYLTTDTVPLVRNVSPRLRSLQGTFVTLKKHGELRGCIGHMLPDIPLARAVETMALEAAFNDTRFDPLKQNELQGLQIEISVLTPMKPIARPEDIVIGRDGVYMIKNGKSAVFLPQVATEQKWDRAEMLNNLCLKAGLAAGSWKQGAQFLVFQAIVFDESQFK